VIDGLFAQFRRALVEGRPAMTQGDLAAATDGRVVTARQALELHMVDAVGYLDDAIDEARRLAGIETSDVILYRAHGGGNANVYARGGLAPALLSGTLAPLLRGGGLMLYLWEPGL